MKIILASSSKRRIDIMKQLGFEFEVISPNVSEFVDSFTSSDDLVMKLAKMKGEAVYISHQDDFVLGFDTLVFLNDGEILGKPQNEEECVKMIKALSNSEHKVVTGVYLKASDYEESFASSCLVHMKEIPEEEIYRYAKTSEPYDKAGGYAVQGFVGRFIDYVEGDIFSVIGFPKAEVYEKLSHYFKGEKDR